MKAMNIQFVLICCMQMVMWGDLDEDNELSVFYLKIFVFHLYYVVNA
ncbi:hypothetical protein ACB098_03G055800 [Castanea mollissima]